MELTIRWKRQAVKQFTDAIKYIEADSPKNAEKFEKEILRKIDELLLQPERYHPDKFKIKNDGSYKAFEVFSYRVSYRFVSNQKELFPIYSCNIIVAAISSTVLLFLRSFFFMPMSSMACLAILEVNLSSTFFIGI